MKMEGEGFYRPQVCVGRVVIHRGCGGVLQERNYWPDKPGEKSWRGFVCQKCGRRVMDLDAVLEIAIRKKGSFSIDQCDLLRALVEAGVGEWEEVEYVKRVLEGWLAETKTARRKMKCRYCGREIKKGEEYGIVRSYAGYNSYAGHAYIARRAVCSDCIALSRALADQPKANWLWKCSTEWGDGW